MMTKFASSLQMLKPKPVSYTNEMLASNEWSVKADTLQTLASNMHACFSFQSDKSVVISGVWFENGLFYVALFKPYWVSLKHKPCCWVPSLVLCPDADHC